MEERKRQGVTKEERMDKLMQAKKEIDHLSDIIGKMIKGSLTSSQAAKEFELTPQKFSRDTNNQFMRQLHKILPPEEGQIREMLKDAQTPYEKLFYRIFGLSAEWHGIIFLDEKTEAHMEDAMSRHLTEKERDVIKHHFGFLGMAWTLEEIGYLYNVNKTRIQSIEAHAIRKLRNPSLWHILVPQYENCVSLAEEIDSLRHVNDMFRKKYEEIVQEYQSLQKENPTLEKENPTLDEMKVVLKQQRKRMMKMSLSEIPMSNLLSNALERQRIYTIGDISNFTLGQLSKIRGIGPKSYAELLTIILKLHIPVKEEREEHE